MVSNQQGASSSSQGESSSTSAPDESFIAYKDQHLKSKSTIDTLFTFKVKVMLQSAEWLHSYGF